MINGMHIKEIYIDFVACDLKISVIIRFISSMYLIPRDTLYMPIKFQSLLAMKNDT